MYLHMPRRKRNNRNKAARLRAKLKAKNRRRVNLQQGRKISRRK